MNDTTFLIYQLKPGDKTRLLRFSPLKDIKAEGRSVEWGNYNHIYTGALDSGMAPINESLERIYETFNLAHPADFAAPSLSMSDIIVIQRAGKTAAFYVDRGGFSDVPEFLAAPYRYYSTQRPVDIGTFPKTESGPVHIVNYDKREYCENATFRAWGFLAYGAPLTERQLAAYELRVASDNPNHTRVSPYQLSAQLEVIGKWEQAQQLSDRARITWFHNDFGVFVKKDWVMDEHVMDRFAGIMEAKARAAENRAAQKKPIAERLAEGAEQAARDNAARPAPAPGRDKEDRA